jgi:hypothetical protein
VRSHACGKSVFPAEEDSMSIRGILRRLLLGLLIGGRSLFGISMSSEKIEELLFSIHQPRAEETVSDNEQDESELK